MQVAYIPSLGRMAEWARNRGLLWNHTRYRRPIVFSTHAYPIPFCPILTDPVAPVSIQHSSSTCNIRGQCSLSPMCRYLSSNTWFLLKNTIKKLAWTSKNVVCRFKKILHLYRFAKLLKYNVLNYVTCGLWHTCDKLVLWKIFNVLWKNILDHCNGRNGWFSNWRQLYQDRGDNFTRGDNCHGETASLSKIIAYVCILGQLSALRNTRSLHTYVTWGINVRAFYMQ